MTAKVALLLCPGRGSYGRAELGSLARALRPGPVADALRVADAARRELGLPAIAELDAAPSFRPGLHLQGGNAGELIYFSTMAQLEGLRERYEIAAVGGNSLGWYTALAAAGCLSVEDGWRLVRLMAELQAGVAGGQVLTTTVDDAWQVDARAAEEVERALAQVAQSGDGHFAARSIRLGGHEVLAGTEAAVRRLLTALPRRVVGEREFPFRLAGNGPFHTALCASVAEAAGGRLAELGWRMPRLHLIDGRGNAHTPWSADPEQLMAYTGGVQVTETFDFSAVVRTGLREFAPDVALCAGPGESLRAPAGHVVIAEGYRGVVDREGLFGSGVVVTE